MCGVQIRDRIKELRRVKARDLRPNAKNWRRHPVNQQNALRGALAEVGYADALIAWEPPDGGLELIDGHLRAEVTPDMAVPVLILDVNADEAAYLLATLDPLSALAERDEVAAADLVATISTENDAVQALLDHVHGATDLPDIPDDGLPDEEPPEDESTADTQAVIGQFRWTIPRDKYDAWLEEVRQSVGFDEPSIIKELQRRLGL